MNQLFYIIVLDNLYKAQQNYSLEEMIRIKTIQQIKQKYEILQQLGRGASGICYHLKNINDHHEYVLKEIPIFLYEFNRLEKQIGILAKIDCPYIIKLHEVYQSASYVYYVYQYNNQTDLQKLIKATQTNGKKFDDKAIWQIFYQLLAGLQYMHSLNIIHRDIKASNIFINEKTLELKIGDLGGSKEMTSAQNYTRIGTPLYLSPQIIRYEAHNQKTDIWSLGVTLYQLITLKHPFQEKNFIKLASKICYNEPEYQQIKSSLFFQPLKDMLKKDAKQRLSAVDLLQKYFINGLPVFNVNSQDLQISSILEGSQCNFDNFYNFESQTLIQYQKFNDNNCNEKVQKSRQSLFKSFPSVLEESHAKMCEPAQQKPVVHYIDEPIQVSVDSNDQSTILLIVKESSSQKARLVTLNMLRSTYNGFTPQTSSIHIKKTLNPIVQKKNKLKVLHKISSISRMDETFQKALQQNKKGTQYKHMRHESALSCKTKHINMMNNLKAKKGQQKFTQSHFQIQTINIPDFVVIDHNMKIFQNY